MPEMQKNKVTQSVPYTEKHLWHVSDLLTSNGVCYPLLIRVVSWRLQRCNMMAVMVLVVVVVEGGGGGGWW